MIKLLILLSLANLLHCWTNSEVGFDNLNNKAFTWAAFLTPRNGKYNISDKCIEAGDIYLDELKHLNIAGEDRWASKMLDAGYIYPSSGLISDGNIFHHPGSFSGCIKINQNYPDAPKEIIYLQR